MNTQTLQAYRSRPVRFLGVKAHVGWRMKTYSISAKAERVDADVVDHVRTLVPGWLEHHKAYPLQNHGIAYLILHEAREGCFAILSWWIDSNMLQTFVHLATDEHRRDFHAFSDRGIFTCVWELAVHWFERNAWVEHVLSHPEDPFAIKGYLTVHLNADI
jgi:hypothetical protein